MEDEIVKENKADYLVVEDPEKQSTWHLPVKVNGKPDHRLMGAAWAALHSGYRGNKYEGPNKQEALKKLKALYKSEGMETPKESAESLPMTFSEYEDTAKSKEVAQNILNTVDVFKELLDNIILSCNNVSSLVEPLCKEFIEKVKMIENITEETAPIESAVVEESFSESADGVEIIEDKKVGTNYLKMHVKLIEPGWGNTHDNNYYPREMLEKYAHKFIGAKMFPVDHTEDGKNVGTWVSNITDIIGFTETGAPIAEVAVIDPNFAEKVRAISSAGLLKDLQCSIMASGVAESGFELDGRKGKKVVEIKQAGDVDWVRRAGAGGMALSLIESADNQPKEDNMEEAEKQEAKIEVQEEQKEAVVIETKIHEDETPESLPTSKVKEILAESKLGEISQMRLLRDKYATEDKVREAILLECKYIDAITEAGKPFGMDGGAPKKRTYTFEEIEEMKNKAIKESIL